MVYPRFFLLTIQIATTPYDNINVLISSLMSATLYTTVLTLLIKPDLASGLQNNLFVPATPAENHA